MPNIKSQIKRLHQNEKRHLRNRYFKGSARTFIKKARVAMDEGNREAAQEYTSLAIKALDKAAEKGVIHKNNAARRKSRLVKRLAAFEKAQAE